MMIVQRAIQSSPRRTYASVKIADQKIGFESGTKVNIFQRGAILLVSTMEEYPGFNKIAGSFKVIVQNNREQIMIPGEWFGEFMYDLNFLRVFYTKHGIFMRPYGGEEFKDYVLSGN